MILNLSVHKEEKLINQVKRIFKKPKIETQRKRLYSTVYKDFEFDKNDYYEYTIRALRECFYSLHRSWSMEVSQNNSLEDLEMQLQKPIEIALDDFDLKAFLDEYFGVVEESSKK